MRTFKGLENEDTHKILEEFHVGCSGMKLDVITEDYIKLSLFPFSVQDVAKEWMYDLPFGSITSRSELVKKFIEK